MTFSHTGPGHLNSARVTFRLARRSLLTSSLPVSSYIMHTVTALHSLSHFPASVKKDSVEPRCRRLSHQRQGQACAEAGRGEGSWTALGSRHCPQQQGRLPSGPHAHSSVNAVPSPLFLTRDAGPKGRPPGQLRSPLHGGALSDLPGLASRLSPPSAPLM